MCSRMHGSFSKKASYCFIYSRYRVFLYTLDAIKNYNQSGTVAQEFSVTQTYTANYTDGQPRFSFAGKVSAVGEPGCVQIRVVNVASNWLTRHQIAHTQRGRRTPRTLYKVAVLHSQGVAKIVPSFFCSPIFRGT